MNCNSSTVSRQVVGTMAGDEPLMYRWKNSCMIKDILKDALGIVRELLTRNDLVYHFPRGVFCRFLFDQFPIVANVLLRLTGVSAERKEFIAVMILT